MTKRFVVSILLSCTLAIDNNDAPPELKLDYHNGTKLVLLCMGRVHMDSYQTWAVERGKQLYHEYISAVDGSVEGKIPDLKNNIGRADDPDCGMIMSTKMTFDGRQFEGATFHCYSRRETNENVSIGTPDEQKRTYHHPTYESQKPVAIFEGPADENLKATCEGFVGSPGIMTWVLQTKGEASIWRISFDSGPRNVSNVKYTDTRFTYDLEHGPSVFSVIEVDVQKVTGGDVSTLNCYTVNVTRSDWNKTAKIQFAGSTPYVLNAEDQGSAEDETDSGLPVSPELLGAAALGVVVLCVLTTVLMRRKKPPPQPPPVVDNLVPSEVSPVQEGEGEPELPPEPPDGQPAKGKSKQEKKDGESSSSSSDDSDTSN